MTGFATGIVNKLCNQKMSGCKICNHFVTRTTVANFCNCYAFTTGLQIKKKICCISLANRKVVVANFQKIKINICGWPAPLVGAAVYCADEGDNHRTGGGGHSHVGWGRLAARVGAVDAVGGVRFAVVVGARAAAGSGHGSMGGMAVSRWFNGGQ